MGKMEEEKKREAQHSHAEREAFLLKALNSAELMLRPEQRKPQIQMAIRAGFKHPYLEKFKS